MCVYSIPKSLNSHHTVVILCVTIVYLVPISTKPVCVNIETKQSINGCNGASFSGRSVLEGDRFSLSEELWTGVGTANKNVVSLVLLFVVIIIIIIID